MKFFTYLFVFSSIASTAAYAVNNDNYLGAGLNIDTFTEELSDRFDLQEEMGLSPVIGWKSTFLWDNVGFRTGVYGEYKNISLDDDLAAPGKDDVSITAYYLSAPLNLLFKATDNFSFFGGVTPRLLVLKSCDNCKSYDDSPNMISSAYNIGGAYEFGNDVSLEVNFLQGISESFDDIKINTAQALVYWKL